MQWTKIPTNILINRLTDQEIVSIVKYQLLWADLEYQPDEKTALRYLTPKQLSIAHQYLDSMESQVTRDVRSSETNRRYRKLNYLKTNKNSENVSITLPITVSNTLQQQNRIDNNNIYIQDSLSASAENPTLFNDTESETMDFPTSAEKKTRQRKTCQSSLGKSFVPPTFDEVISYAQTRIREDLAKTFFDYYNVGNWKDAKGNQIKNWKQKFITWENKNPKKEELKYQPKLDDEIRAKL